MSIALFFVLAIIAAAVIVQPLLPGSRASYPLPAARGRGTARPPQPQAATKGGAACPKCGAPVKVDDRFCVRCGGAIAEPAAASVCASCGAALGEDDRFCRRCGAGVPGREVQQ